MFDKFEALSEEKRLRIINSALEEFSLRQFKNASTDAIAKNAGISKGALFQYFGSKRQLFQYVYKYACDTLAKEIWAKVDLSNPDILERLKGIFMLKMSLYRKYPSLFAFLLNAYARETDEEIRELIKEDFDSQKSGAYSKIFENIDYGKIRKGFDPEKVVSIIIWAMEGYSNTEAAKLKSEDISMEKYRHWLKELDLFIYTFRKAFYEEEEENRHGQGD